MKSGIYVVATPIGNLNDISFRALEVLQNADVIACEDTRVTKKLFSLLGLGLKKTFVTLHDHNEEEQAQKLIDMVNRGQSIAQVSDAGCPLISDPGYKLIKRCREQGVAVTTIPTNSFMFAGFIPNKDKARKDLFNKLKDIDATLVFYETANRIVKTLETAGEVFSLREMAVAREITKVYEECVNGSAAELIEHFSQKEPKGEMVLMIAPPTPGEAAADLDIAALIRRELAENSLKTAVKNVVSQYGLNKNEVYELALKIKDE